MGKIVVFYILVSSMLKAYGHASLEDMGQIYNTREYECWPCAQPLRAADPTSMESSVYKLRYCGS